MRLCHYAKGKKRGGAQVEKKGGGWFRWLVVLYSARRAESELELADVRFNTPFHRKFVDNHEERKGCGTLQKFRCCSSE